jgi:unsaturated rhamnogalacturonyl hydrolase
MQKRNIDFSLDEKGLALSQQKLETVVSNFKKTLYEEDEAFINKMKTSNLGGDDISKYRYWEWPQGVGLFGLWKLFELTGQKKYFDMIIRYYEQQLSIGLPSKNVNTTAPLLTLACLFEHTQEERYRQICVEWADWLMDKLPRTKEGGFQHMTSDSLNENELWVDTLFMTVLFLAKIGCILGKKEWLKEAEYQFLLHTKYLTDRKTGLWYHGWSFKENTNFAQALWGRGNSWITIAIPEFISMAGCGEGIKKLLIETLKRQIEALDGFQDSNGMWHTLIDDNTSYAEASATCGFSYGILKAAGLGIIDEKFKALSYKALPPVLELIDSKGHLNQVSYGTYMGRQSRQYYKDIITKPMPYGQAMAILFLTEILRQQIRF